MQDDEPQSTRLPYEMSSTSSFQIIQHRGQSDDSAVHRWGSAHLSTQECQYKNGLGLVLRSSSQAIALISVVMSQPDNLNNLTVTPPPSFGIPSYLIPTDERQAPAGASIENPASLLDHDFNFQIVVFKVYSFFKSSYEETITTPFQKVENTLFQVLKNSFNVPGTPFEAMFTLPQTQTDGIEGSSLENPIHLPGIKVDHFRPFLRVLYPLCVW